MERLTGQIIALKAYQPEILCKIFGHDIIEEARIDNEQSQYGTYICLRCGMRHDWQYDK